MMDGTERVRMLNPDRDVYNFIQNAIEDDWMGPLLVDENGEWTGYVELISPMGVVMLSYRPASEYGIYDGAVLQMVVRQFTEF